MLWGEVELVGGATGRRSGMMVYMEKGVGVRGWGYREKKWNDGMEKGVRGWGYREKKWNDGMEKGVGVRGWDYREKKWNDGMEKGRGGTTSFRSCVIIT